jgi:V/A-type H+-transporting ATPase subunit C
MADNTGSQALTAKLHSMYGRRLTQQNYRELVRKQTVNEAASYIKQQTAYGQLLRDVNENLIHRGQLENILRRDLFDEYLKIFHYVSRDEFNFYRFLVTKMEINEVLSCIRLLNAGREDEYIFSLPSFSQNMLILICISSLSLKVSTSCCVCLSIHHIITF